MSALTLSPITPPGPVLSLELGDPDAVQLSGGVGGWDVINRPRRQQATEWSGTPLYELSVPVIIDALDLGPDRGRKYDGTVEVMCRRLAALARADTTTGEPPILRVSGAVPHMGFAWVMQQIEWGASITTMPNGHRSQQQATLSLLEHVAAEVGLSPAKRRTATTAPKSKPRTTTVLRSDLPQGLARVAARTLGSSSRAMEIGRLNGIRDPMRVRVGQVLRLP